MIMCFVSYDELMKSTQTKVVYWMITQACDCVTGDKLLSSFCKIQMHTVVPFKCLNLCIDIELNE